ncbi:hypothetical protein Pmani_031688 [Petrolisthes manimaculis]|uniref:Guided entry of tail-anchored proteins factor 1 n=1 Tax=Petrolisthes manimaculis TaxID=1843537 RepID=A0AAE1NV69_9EUCA|nr:hypothetical protein Pmani_031688 [Petrolisthes manimaculis]
MGCAGVVFPAIFQFILKLVRGEGVAELQIRQEVAKLKQQLQSISMVDQFATYARLQRKINTLNQQYRDKVSERSVRAQRARLVVDGLIRAVVGMLSMWLIWEHRSDPVLSLPAGLVWPLGHLLSFPSCQLGQMSMIVWLSIVRAVCGRTSGYFTFANPKPPPRPPSPVFTQTRSPVSIPLD